MKARLNHLQTLRGVAVLLVIWHHSTFLIGKETRDMVLGFTGVPLFFTISGFIMVYTTRKLTGGIQHIGDFVIKRLIRILPLFYFAVLLWLLICRKDFIVNPQLDKLVNTIAFLPHFTDQLGPFYGFWILGVNWSLNYEMFFYLLFAMSFFFASYRYYFLYTVFILILVFLPLMINGQLSFDITSYYSYGFEYFNLMSNPILWYFVCGITIGLMVDKLSVYLSNHVAIKLLYVFSVLFFILYLLKIVPSGFAFEFTACSILVLAAVMSDLSQVSSFYSPKGMIFLGDISYSIYLMHAVIFMYIPLVAEKFGIKHLLQTWYVFIPTLGLVLCVSIITYYLIEVKFTNFLRMSVFGVEEKQQQIIGKRLKIS